MKNNNEKINSSCLKIFKFLSLLYENNATYQNVINIFKDELEEQSNNNLQVVLNKYLNTLKIFGIKVNKKNNKYIIESSLYSINYTLNDLKSISMLINFCKNISDDECSKNINEFIENLKLRMDNSNKNALTNISENYNVSFYYSELKEQIEECKKCCNSNLRFELTYTKNKKQHKIKCEAKDLIYSSKTVHFQVYDIDKNSILNIPISSIMSINFLPNKVKSNESPVTIIYKLKGRLAKSYKLKLNEYSQGFNEKREQIIVNKGEPVDQLISRFMRYSYNCEIISPKFVREEMINLINETLKQYD